MHVIGSINLQLHATMMKLAADIVWDFNWCSQTLSRLQHDPVSSSAFLRETSSWSFKMQYQLSPFPCWKLLWCWNMCFRVNKGQFVLAHTAWFPSICTVAECEATALLLSLRLAASKGFVHVTLRVIAKLLWMLCTILVLMRMSRISYFPGVGLLYLLKQSYNLTFIRRQANRVTHNLTRASIFQSSLCIFISPPICIASLILDEIREVVSD